MKMIQYLKKRTVSKLVPEVCVVDIEADNLDPLKVNNIWVVSFKIRNNTFSYSGDLDVADRSELIRREFNPATHPNRYFVFHNGFGYDIPLLRAKLKVMVPTNRVIDTMVLSYLYDAHNKEGHSLESWGKVFGIKKVYMDNEQWHKWDPRMVERCATDVAITSRLFDYLNTEMFNGKLLNHLWVGGNAK